MVEIPPTKGTQLELFDSSVKNKNESISDDSSVNPHGHLTGLNSIQAPCPQLSDRQHKILISYLTKRDKAEKKYGSGWLTACKSGGTARTDNQYLKYFYRVHWRKKPICLYLGSTKSQKGY